MDWFENFHRSLLGDSASADLTPAGNLSPAEAIEHYRYQYRAKVAESIGDSFPALKARLGSEWERVLEDFLSAGFSHRSLDFHPAGFEAFYLSRNPGIDLAELCRFEGLLDRYSWTHRAQPVNPSLEFSEDSIFEVGAYVVESFKADVVSLYEAEVPTDAAPLVIIWIKNSETHFRSLLPWENQFLLDLSGGRSLGDALGTLDQPQDKLQHFFHWLGGSGLLRRSITMGSA